MSVEGVNKRRFAGPSACVAAVVLVGCGPWTWRAPGARYAPTRGDVPTYSSLAEAAPDLAPEAYAIGRSELEGRDLDGLLPRLARQAAKAGAHLLVIDDVEAITSTWNTTFTPRDPDSRVVSRQEQIRVSQSTARVEATALRNPSACLGIVAICDRPFAGQSCQARVVAAVPGGPALAAGVQAGNVVASVDGRPVAHPWDLYQRVDRTSPGSLHRLEIHDASGGREIEVVSADCATLYPG